METLFSQITMGQQDPCADLQKLADDLVAKNKQVTKDVEELTKANGAKPLTALDPMINRETVAKAIAAIDDLHICEGKLNSFDISARGKELMSLADRWTENDTAIREAKRIYINQKTDFDEDKRLEVKIKEINESINLNPAMQPGKLDALKASLKAAHDEHSAIHAKIHSPEIDAKLAKRKPAEQELLSITPRLDELKAERKQISDVKDKAAALATSFNYLGNEAEIRAKKTQIDLYDAEVGKLIGKANEADLKLKADQAAATAAATAFNEKNTELSLRAQEEANRATWDASLDQIGKKFWEQNRDLKAWAKDSLKNKAIEERAAHPELWTPKEKYDERLKYYRDQLAKQVTEGNLKMKETEATRLEKVRTDFLHLPCRVEEKQINDEIREKIDFLRHPKGAGANGIDDEIGVLPDLEIPPFEEKNKEENAQGLPGEPAPPGPLGETWVCDGPEIKVTAGKFKTADEKGFSFDSERDGKIFSSEVKIVKGPPLKVRINQRVELVMTASGQPEALNHANWHCNNTAAGNNYILLDNGCSNMGDRYKGDPALKDDTATVRMYFGTNGQDPFIRIYGGEWGDGKHVEYYWRYRKEK